VCDTALYNNTLLFCYLIDPVMKGVVFRKVYYSRCDRKGNWDCWTYEFVDLYRRELHFKRTM